MQKSLRNNEAQRIKMRVIQFGTSLLYRANNAFNWTGSLRRCDRLIRGKSGSFRNGKCDAPRGVEIGERVPIVSWPLLQIQYPPILLPFLLFLSFFLFSIHLDVIAYSRILPIRRCYKTYSLTATIFPSVLQTRQK